MKPSPAFSFFQVCSKFQGQLVETETEEDYDRFCKEGKFCQLLWLISTIANRQQFFYIWYQRLFEFLEDAGRSSNTITPTTWLRYTDNDKVKRSFYKKKLEVCEGGHMGGLFDQTGSFDAHSVASHFWANWFHWCLRIILKNEALPQFTNISQPKTALVFPMAMWGQKAMT